MISVTRTIDPNIIIEVVCDKHIWNDTHGQDLSLSREHYKPDMSWIWLVAKLDGHLVGVVNFKKQTHLVLEAHIRILPTYQGSKVSLEVANKCFEFMKETTEAINCMSFVPSNRHNVLSWCKKVGFNICGMIKDGIWYNQELVDLIIINKILREE